MLNFRVKMPLKRRFSSKTYVFFAEFETDFKKTTSGFFIVFAFLYRIFKNQSQDDFICNIKYQQIYF